MSPVAQPVHGIAQGYLVFARAFDYPHPEFWDAVEGKPWAECVGEIEEGGASSREPDAVIPKRPQEAREAEYLNLFELGGIPLYEGLHRQDEGREGILEDLLRFYHFFDLRLRVSGRDYPDHLVTELEFMGYLVAREAEALEGGNDPGPYRRAEHDFLARHLCVWVPSVEARVATLLPSSSVYRPLLSALSAFLAAHTRRLDQQMEGEV